MAQAQVAQRLELGDGACPARHWGVLTEMRRGAVNMAASANERVTTDDFELLSVLGTGGAWSSFGAAARG